MATAWQSSQRPCYSNLCGTHHQAATFSEEPAGSLQKLSEALMLTVAKFLPHRDSREVFSQGHLAPQHLQGSVTDEIHGYPLVTMETRRCGEVATSLVTELGFELALNLLQSLIPISVEVWRDGVK